MLILYFNKMYPFRYQDIFYTYNEATNDNLSRNVPCSNKIFQTVINKREH